MTLQEFYDYADSQEGYWEFYGEKPEPLPLTGTRHAQILQAVMLQMHDYFYREHGELGLHANHSVQTDLYLANDTSTEANLLCSVVPDILVCDPACIQTGFVVGAPLMVLEVWSFSDSETYMARKRECYRKAGVRYFIEIAAKGLNIRMLNWETGEAWHRTLQSAGDSFSIPFFEGLAIQPYTDVFEQWLLG